MHKHFGAEIKGLDAFPRKDWPDNIALLYYAYHVMAGLGTIFIGIMLLSVILLGLGRLYRTTWVLWVLMLSAPFPYIANTAGWMTADGTSPLVHSGNALFTLIGFSGLYLLLGLLFLFLFFETVHRGPLGAVGRPGLRHRPVADRKAGRH